MIAVTVWESAAGERVQEDDIIEALRIAVGLVFASKSLAIATQKLSLFAAAAVALERQGDQPLDDLAVTHTCVLP